MGWFGLGKKEVSQAAVDAALEKKTEEARHDDPYQSVEVRDFLGQIRVNQENVRLHAIQQNADTLLHYLQLLTQDLGLYASAKDEAQKEKQKQGIATKVKMITQRSLELKNLIALLGPHYFEILKGRLLTLFEMTKDKEVEEVIRNIDADMNKIGEVDACLSRIVRYNELLNGEKNQNFGEEIVRAAQAHEIHKDIEQFVRIIRTVVLDRNKGVIGKIQQEKWVAALKRKIEE